MSRARLWQALKGVMTAINNGPLGLTEIVRDTLLSVAYEHNKGS